MFGDLLILVLSSFISIKPVLDFLNASTITLKSFERRLNLLSKQTQVITNIQEKLKPNVKTAVGAVHADRGHLDLNKQLKITLPSRLVVLCFYLLNLIITSKGTQPSSNLICSFRNLSLGRL